MHLSDLCQNVNNVLSLLYTFEYVSLLWVNRRESPTSCLKLVIEPPTSQVRRKNCFNVVVSNGTFQKRFFSYTVYGKCIKCPPKKGYRPPTPPPPPPPPPPYHTYFVRPCILIRSTSWRQQACTFRSRTHALNAVTRAAMPGHVQRPYL